MNYNPNSRFANYVTNIAFNLSLSRAMCSLLLAIQAEEKRCKEPGVNPWRSECSGFGDFAPAVRALERRGLVKHYPNAWPNGPEGMGANIITPAWQLTEEGNLVAQLVRMAGINGNISNTEEIAS